MRGKRLCSLFLVFHFFSVCFTLGDPKKFGFKVTNLDKCDAGPKAYKWDFSLNNVDADEWKSFDLDGELPEPMTDKFSYTLDIDHFNQGDWETNVYNMEGNLCEMLEKFLSKAWNKMANSLEPKMDGPCDAKPGKYTLRGLEVKREDITIPPMYGKTRSTLKVYNEADEMVLCLVGLVQTID